MEASVSDARGSVRPDVTSRQGATTRASSTGGNMTSESRGTTAATTRDDVTRIRSKTRTSEEAKSDVIKPETNATGHGFFAEHPRKREKLQRRLKRQLNARTLRRTRKHSEPLKLPRLASNPLPVSLISPLPPSVTPGFSVSPSLRNHVLSDGLTHPSVTIHHPQLGKIEQGHRVSQGATSGMSTPGSRAASRRRSARRASARGAALSHGPLTQPPSLPTIREYSELTQTKKPTKIPINPSLVTAYKNLTFAHQLGAPGHDVTPEKSRGAWRTLPMQSELDKYLSFLGASKKQSHTFSRHVLPGLGFERGALTRPRSPQQTVFERQKTRFGQDTIWNAYRDNAVGQRSQASKLKSAQGRTDRLVSQLKHVLEEQT